MSLRDQLRAHEQRPAVRVGLMLVGFALIAVSPLVGVIPGPGGLVVFAGGLTLILRYSLWARRQYARFKRRWPKQGAWTDWGLRRRSAKRRLAREQALRDGHASD